ncbi:MAG: zinc metalloprotease HtpX [Fibrobacter sp.]|nr:zinc metalloprotease HtpX [Fibrobacter sp.]
MNGLKTTALLGALTGILVLFGNYLGGGQGATIALLVAGVMNFGSWWFSDKIVLSMYKAQKVEKADAPVLYNIVERLTQRARMPMPKVYIINSESPNAFATGRSPDHASVAATVGILRLLSEDELEGVMAHELAHVQNRDTLTGTIAATIAGAITWVANMVKWGAMFGGGRSDDNDRGGAIGMLFMAILAPIAASLIQLAISRSREYVADESGAQICGKPLALANALSKLQNGAKVLPMNGGNPSTAHLFIVNPFRGGLASLFSTHPPMEERIRRLEALARRS